jgi:hypothetical protein
LTSALREQHRARNFHSVTPWEQEDKCLWEENYKLAQN